MTSKCCLNCHFLCEWTREPDPNHSSMLKRPLTREQRARLADGEDPSNVKEKQHMDCARYVWTLTMVPEKPCVREELRQDRADSCFWWPYTPGTKIETAEELERREAKRREAKRHRKLVKWSIVAGAIGAVIGAVLKALLTPHE